MLKKKCAKKNKKNSAKEKNMYFKTTEAGYSIKRIYAYRSCEKVYHAIIFYRRDREDYGIGLNYNFNEGTWAQGVYDFKTEIQAIEYLRKIKKNIMVEY